jgi:hypothetical protein
MSDAPDFSGAANADCVDAQVHDGVANKQRPYNLRLREKRPVVSQKMQMSGQKQKVRFVIVLALSFCWMASAEFIVILCWLTCCCDCYR